MNPRSATVVAAALAATAVLAVVAFVAWPGARSEDFGATSPGDADLSANDVVPAITARNLGPTITFRSAAPEDVAKYEPAIPERLAIPAVGLAMKVEPKGLANDGSMALPDVAAVAAWYSHGAVPGDRDGAALIAAHVATDADGVGPFARLRDLHSGDAVSVTLTDGSQQIVRRGQAGTHFEARR